MFLEVSFGGKQNGTRGVFTNNMHHAILVNVIPMLTKRFWVTVLEWLPDTQLTYHGMSERSKHLPVRHDEMNEQFRFGMEGQQAMTTLTVLLVYWRRFTGRELARKTRETRNSELQRSPRNSELG